MSTFKTYADLRSMSEEELIDQYDQRAGHTAVGTGFIRDELHRREQDAATMRLERMTRTIVRLTYAVTVLTTLSLVSAATAIVLSLMS